MEFFSFGFWASPQEALADRSSPIFTSGLNEEAEWKRRSIMRRSSTFLLDDSSVEVLWHTSKASYHNVGFLLQQACKASPTGWVNVFWWQSDPMFHGLHVACRTMSLWPDEPNINFEKQWAALIDDDPFEEALDEQHYLNSLNSSEAVDSTI